MRSASRPHRSPPPSALLLSNCRTKVQSHLVLYLSVLLSFPFFLSLFSFHGLPTYTLSYSTHHASFSSSLPLLLASVHFSFSSICTILLVPAYLPFLFEPPARVNASLALLVFGRNSHQCRSAFALARALSRLHQTLFYLPGVSLRLSILFYSSFFTMCSWLSLCMASF